MHWLLGAGLIGLAVWAGATYGTKPGPEVERSPQAWHCGGQVLTHDEYVVARTMGLADLRGCRWY